MNFFNVKRNPIKTFSTANEFPLKLFQQEFPFSTRKPFSAVEEFPLKLFQRQKWFRFVCDWLRGARLKNVQLSSFGVSPQGSPGIKPICYQIIKHFVIKLSSFGVSPQGSRCIEPLCFDHPHVKSLVFHTKVSEIFRHFLASSYKSLFCGQERKIAPTEKSAKTRRLALPDQQGLVNWLHKRLGEPD